MIETITHENKEYPKFQTIGYASQFIMPYAKQVCKGQGYDIGCMRKEWSFPGSIPIDLSFEDGFHAMNLPYKDVDYIFSSHCLEHISNWVEVLNYWTSTLKSGGTLFLYLPDYSQTYWRPWYNRKHFNIFSSLIIKDYMTYAGYTKIFNSEVDLYNAFAVFGEKK
jgi:SAM-dependent methyltransferase